MMILLVAQDDTPNSAPEAQVIASAIAAFRYNNIKRGDRNLQPLEVDNYPMRYHGWHTSIVLQSSGYTRAQRGRYDWAISRAANHSDILHSEHPLSAVSRLMAWRYRSIIESPCSTLTLSEVSRRNAGLSSLSECEEGRRVMALRPQAFIGPIKVLVAS